MKKVSFHNLGCKVNSYETEAMIRQFTDHGYLLVDFDEPADVCIVNTCTVTGIADRKSRQMLHRAKKLNPDAVVVAAGCYVQADPARCQSDPAIDIIVGNDEKSKIYELVTAMESRTCDIGNVREFEELYVDDTALHTRAFLKVQDGCNQFCSYCLIPYVRGRVRSRKTESVCEEVKRLADKGCREVVLTGIHLSSYGTDGGAAQMGPPLLDLIDAVSRVIGDGRIRLGSLEPRIITPRFVSAIASFDKLCPHFHLSLQSGCDATLRRMNRHYSTEEYALGCELLRDTYEHPAITTDVIVGFPGESSEEFEQTAVFLEKIDLYEMHVFKYSLRAGTAAERLPGRVPPDIAEERSNILLEMSARHRASFAAYYRDHASRVLLEEKEIREGEEYLTGYNPEYVRFLVKGEDLCPGDFIDCVPGGETKYLIYEQ